MRARALSPVPPHLHCEPACTHARTHARNPPLAPWPDLPVVSVAPTPRAFAPRRAAPPLSSAMRFALPQRQSLVLILPKNPLRLVTGRLRFL